ncbi:hypothetical protein C0J52_28206, partial [Blattella germanica]
FKFLECLKILHGFDLIGQNNKFIKLFSINSLIKMKCEVIYLQKVKINSIQS